MEMRKRGISHVYSTEPLNKNAVLTINVREYILFNQIAMKPLTEGNVLDREFRFTTLKKLTLAVSLNEYIKTYFPI